MDNQEFYIHRKGTFTGNAPSFWAKGASGYTSYVQGARRFKADEAYELYKSDPQKWEMFNCDEVDKRLHLVFDMQDKRKLGTNEPCGQPFGYAELRQQLAKPAVEPLLEALRDSAMKLLENLSFDDEEGLFEHGDQVINLRDAIAAYDASK